MRRKAQRALIAVAVAVLTAASAHAAKPPKPEWNQVANVKDAAKRMGELHRRQGAEAALKFLEACYKTHTLAEKFTQGLEACMAQDYMFSQMLAVVYSRVPQEKLQDMKAPTPAVIARSMQGRFQAIFQQYKLTQAQADGLKAAVDKYGMPIFVKTVFPKRGNGKNDETGKSNGEGKGELNLPTPPAISLPPAEKSDGPGTPAQPSPGGQAP